MTGGSLRLRVQSAASAIAHVCSAISMNPSWEKRGLRPLTPIDTSATVNPSKPQLSNHRNTCS